MKRIGVIILILAATVAQSMADGKMFWREEIPPKIPYQRALILFDEGTETLILQSRYEIPEGDEKSSIGWVVPVPAVPEVASMSADTAHHMFMYLSMNTFPKVSSIAYMVLAVVFFAVVGLSLLTLFFCLLSFVMPFPEWFMKNRRRLTCFSVFGLLICSLPRIAPAVSVVVFFAVVGLSLLTLLFCLLSFVLPLPQWFMKKRRRLTCFSVWSLLICTFLMAIIIPLFTGTRGSRGIDVVSEQRVGIYDVSVVRSGDAEGLIDWLNKHDFEFQDNDTAAFDAYISKDWCFAVATINPSMGEKKRRIVSEGLAAPLILRFPHANPVYPLALTGTGGFETEILLYLASSTKMTCDDRVTLRFAGPMYERGLELLPVDIDPEGFFDSDTMNYPYLCKFKDRLTPDKMSDDIIFSEAEDDEPYREHIVKW